MCCLNQIDITTYQSAEKAILCPWCCLLMIDVGFSLQKKPIRKAFINDVNVEVHIIF
jgi:hypothetical protein